MCSKLVIGCCFCLTVVASPAVAQQKPGLNGGTEVGRYQIIFNPQVRADTFLLDTATGRIWQLTRFTDLKQEPSAWLYMSRLDNDQEVVIFGRGYQLKPTGPTKGKP